MSNLIHNTNYYNTHDPIPYKKTFKKDIVLPPFFSTYKEHILSIINFPIDIRLKNSLLKTYYAVCMRSHGKNTPFFQSIAKTQQIIQLCPKTIKKSLNILLCMNILTYTKAKKLRLVTPTLNSILNKSMFDTEIFLCLTRLYNATELVLYSYLNVEYGYLLTSASNKSETFFNANKKPTKCVVPKKLLNGPTITQIINCSLKKYYQALKKLDASGILKLTTMALKPKNKFIQKTAYIFSKSFDHYCKAIPFSIFKTMGKTLDVSIAFAQEQLTFFTKINQALVFT